MSHLIEVALLILASAKDNYNPQKRVAGVIADLFCCENVLGEQIR